MRFPKSNRIRVRRDFLAIAKEKNRAAGRFICIDTKQSEETRLGITASRRYGNAVERNRFKRLVREAFRIAKPQLPQDIDIHVVPRQLAKKAGLRDIQDEICRLV